MRKNSILRNKFFWLQILLAIVLVILMLFGISLYLNKYTRHDKEFATPYLINSEYDDLVGSATVKDIHIVIEDSVYMRNTKPGVVLQQDPEAGTLIKPGRKVYVVLSSDHPGMTKMPDLRDVTLRQAMNTLDVVGLTLGAVKYVPSFDKDAVQSQYYKGREIAPGTELKKGSSIDLDVGAGDDVMTTTLPFLYGENILSCRKAIRRAQLNIGNEYFLDSDDVNNSVAYKMTPAWYRSSSVDKGTKVDVYYRLKDNINVDSLKFVMSFPVYLHDSASAMYMKYYRNIPFSKIDLDTIMIDGQSITGNKSYEKSNTENYEDDTEDLF